jgi:hypothetical protein
MLEFSVKYYVTKKNNERFIYARNHNVRYC